MTFVEIRFIASEEMILGFSKLQLNLGLDAAVEYITPLLTASVQHIYLKDVDSEQTIKLEKKDNIVSQSFILDFLELDKLF